MPISKEDLQQAPTSKLKASMVTCAIPHLPSGVDAKGTVVVEVTRRVAHGEYGKIQTLRVKYKAHVEDHDYPKKVTVNEGDKVVIAETRPFSKDKRWRVVKVLEKATQA